MVQSILLSVGAGILLLVGFLGTFVPVLPGAPLAWGGLLLAYFSPANTISVKTLVICGIAAVAVSVIDNVFPEKCRIRYIQVIRNIFDSPFIQVTVRQD